MKINKQIKKLASKFPGLSLVGYTVLKQVWKVEAKFVDYQYPKDAGLATIPESKVLEYNKNRPFGPKKRICYAPFNNLHFQMNGDVSSCSFNYDYIIGNVYDQTIREIWFGEKAEAFRKTLANYDLDKCLSCKNVLASGNFSSFPPLKYDIHSSDTSVFPTQMSFEISDLCNYECIMCYEDFSSLIRKNRAKLPPIKYKYPENFAEQLREFIPHLSIATFIGGEPLLVKAYFQIWEDIIRLNADCTIHIQTNGSFLPPRFLEMLESGRFEIGVSIDAPTKETFEKIRINANFDEVRQNIEILAGYMKRNKIYMNFNFCPLTVNWKEIPAMVEFANHYNVPLKIVNVENPRHLSLPHRNSAYLAEVSQYLNSHIPTARSGSIVVKRNLQTLEHYAKHVAFLRQEALKREAVLEELTVFEVDELLEELHSIFIHNKLFVNFTTPVREQMFDKVKAYIFNRYTDMALVRKLLARLVLHFRINEHQVDSSTSREPEEGLKVLRRVISEFYELERQQSLGVAEAQAITE